MKNYLTYNWKPHIICFKLPAFLFSFLFSFCMILGNKIHFSGNVGDSYTKNYFDDFAFTDFILGLLIWIIIYFIYQILTLILQWYHSKHSQELVSLTYKKQLKIWGFSSLLLFLAWTPYLLALAPGSVLGDSLLSIGQALGYAPLNNHHPVAYTLFVKIFISIGQHFHHLNLGVFLYSITQSIIMASALGFSLLWLYKKGVPKWFLILAGCFYAFFPIFPAYAVIMWKDPLFSIALFLMSLLLYDIVESNGALLATKKGWVLYTVITLIISFFRNNGIYVCIVSLILLIFIYRKKLWRFYLIAFASLALTLWIQGPLYTSLGIQQESVEAYGIPLQQMGRVVALNGKLTEEQKEFLFQLLPEETYKEKYTPCLVDTLKWDPNFNQKYLEEHKAEFFKTWASMLIPNFSEYVKGYCLETFGFWKIGVQNDYGYIDTYISENSVGIHRIDLFEKFFGIPMESFFANFKIYIGSGTLAFVMLWSAFSLWSLKRSKEILCLLPSFITWLVILVATPVAFSLRYVYVLPLALPLFIVLPFFRSRKNKKRARTI
ncbi:DUF6020 family protein [Anaerosacchariphilus polymeriproducens]|uniref:Glycosyltransferase RgtA/B/C/D-like domain-containing protein n=1 Tax=Anaerosacchariphilus polymeriproducens TaxID=1812858 RepID=A0A371ARF8_9FIRM|nr:DUF6020 family protein [Anaerosacchariphilus polymeriproducens]RDU22161.1 hypothetical protein DWV06_16660 [Anaerosacchariphilus polymeriproducens]